MLDVLFTLNIALAMIVMLVSLNSRRPLDFSVFPTVLLLTTLLFVARFLRSLDARSQVAPDLSGARLGHALS